jgi:hypothetical protein
MINNDIIKGKPKIINENIIFWYSKYKYNFHNWSKNRIFKRKILV